MSHENDIITKYQCKHCSKNEMIVNKRKSYVCGYRCIKCGGINYPGKDALRKIERASSKITIELNNRKSK